MIQLQSRITAFIGDVDFESRQWTLEGEATIVAKWMKEAVRTGGHVGGERAYRIVNTKVNPEKEVK